jgi:pimeloyl-ACP methyl ester carboxylesterase
MNPREFTFDYKALQLAVVEHGAIDAPVILALHGWQDNAASFEPLAAQLGDYRILAPDLPGHGRSAWRHPQAGYGISSYLEEMLALLDHLALESCVFMGHSMGGAVAALMAALYPERCRALVLLDNVGPFSIMPEQAPARMREALEQLRSDKLNRRNHYAGMEAAIIARAKNGLHMDAARLLARRGVVEDPKGPWWRLDPRLYMPNLLSMSEAQTEAFLRRINSATCLVAANSYWLERRDMLQLRLGYFGQIETHFLDGGHHQHMEDQVQEVALIIRDFLEAKLA